MPENKGDPACLLLSISKAQIAKHTVHAYIAYCSIVAIFHWLIEMLENKGDTALSQQDTMNPKPRRILIARCLLSLPINLNNYPNIVREIQRIFREYCACCEAIHPLADQGY